MKKEKAMTSALRAKGMPQGQGKRRGQAKREDRGMLTDRFSQRNTELAQEIANDIHEGINNHQSINAHRIAVDYWSCACTDEASKRMAAESELRSTIYEAITALLLAATGEKRRLSSPRVKNRTDTSVSLPKSSAGGPKEEKR